MNIAILHFHLNRGGVTQVIANHLRSLNAAVDGTEPYRVALVHGGRCQGWPADLPARLPALELQFCEIPALDYDTHDGVGGPASERELAELLQTELDRIGFSARNTLLHVHNHSLGKNVSLPGSLVLLAEAGYRMLLEIHDFVEDFRAAAYARLCRTLAGGDADRLAGKLYPQASHIHYGVLNSRDRQLLTGAGFARSRLHQLPNPVPGPETLPDRAAARRRLAAECGIPPDGPLLVYPVRGIARKNLGELLLWSALSRGAAWMATTLAPLNPAEQPRYQAWKRLARRLDLPCTFEVGRPGGLSFPENLAAADRIITTSLVEGFGMVFLESWLTGRPLVGRDLPEITSDFKDAGIAFPRLRPFLVIPVDWIGRAAFREAMATAYRAALADYGRPLPADDQLAGSIERLIVDGDVDFGSLSAPMQRHVINMVCGNARWRGRLLETNGWLEAACTEVGADELAIVQRNGQVVRNRYGLLGSGQRLLAVYRQVAASDCRLPLAAPRQGRTILDGLLDVTRFRPVTGAA